LRVEAHPTGYRPHRTHCVQRAWPQANCYLDLWIELLHCLGHDPIPALACTLSADHDGVSWTFIKPAPEDLRRLYGLDVAEDNAWLPTVDLIELGSQRGVLHTVEVDGWWLPDTAGTSYRHEHLKTAITPTSMRRRQRVMRYLHNSGLYELAGEDFDGIFGTDARPVTALAPYIEVIRNRPDLIEPDVLSTIVGEHLARRPSDNPIVRLADCVGDATGWLADGDLARFHRWAFASIRQCGATAELLADFVEHIDGICPGAAAAAAPFRTVATQTKLMQFKLARIPTGRKVDVTETLSVMTESWQTGMDIVSAAAG